MSTILINYNVPLPGTANYTGSIARNDVTTTFQSIGSRIVNWRPLLTILISKVRVIGWKIGDFLQAFRELPHIHKGDDLFFQYPYEGIGVNLQCIIKVLRFRKPHITLLIHDLEFLRYPEIVSAEEQIKTLNNVDCLLVHTVEMQNRLKALGVTTEMKPMILFDYYAKDPYRDIEEQLNDKNVIAFAGNLNKSVFLHKLDDSIIPLNITYRFYGTQPKITFYNQRIDYQGKFSPEHTGVIHAGWGLVWDGESIDTCSGHLGNYLRIIAPHKLSLYIASGIPVIVWSKSAHAKFVQDNKIGFAVDSIEDIYDKIINISNENYKEMVVNTRHIGNQLRGGGI